MQRSMFAAAVAAGVLCASQVCAQETQTYTYDTHGRLTEVTRTSGLTIQATSYTLDNADNRTQRATTVSTTPSMISQGKVLAEPELETAPPSAQPRPQADAGAGDSASSDTSFGDF